MIDWTFNLWKQFCGWASAQPVFVQVAIGLGLVLIGLYAVAWVMGITFLTFLKSSEKKNQDRG